MASGDTLLILTPLANEPPASNYATKELDQPLNISTGDDVYVALVAGGTWNLTGLANSIEVTFYFEV